MVRRFYLVVTKLEPQGLVQADGKSWAVLNGHHDFLLTPPMPAQKLNLVADHADLVPSRGRGRADPMAGYRTLTRIPRSAAKIPLGNSAKTGALETACAASLFSQLKQMITSNPEVTPSKTGWPDFRSRSANHLRSGTIAGRTDCVAHNPLNTWE